MINKKLLGLQDARSNRGIFARGKARQRGIRGASRPKKVFDLQKAARERLQGVRRL